MKTQLTKLTLSAFYPTSVSRLICGILLASSSLVYAGEMPVPQKAPIEKLCPIPGLYTEHVLGEFTIIACALVSTKTCVYLPGPCETAPGSIAPGQSVPAPLGLDVPEGQKFIARYDSKGQFIVKYVDDYTFGTQKNDDGSHSITITYR